MVRAGHRREPLGRQPPGGRFEGNDPLPPEPRGYLKLYDPQIRLYGYSPEPMDKEAVRGFYQMIHAAFPGSALTIDEEVSDGDRMALRFTQTGIHKGEFMGLPATGKQFSMPGQTVLHFREGRSWSGGRPRTCSACLCRLEPSRHRAEPLPRPLPPTQRQGEGIGRRRSQRRIASQAFTRNRSRSRRRRACWRVSPAGRASIARSRAPVMAAPYKAHDGCEGS